MPIPSLEQVIVTCWTDAERILQADVERKHFDLDEEALTTYFRGELRERVSKASNEGRIGDAFRYDLTKAFPSADSSKLHKIAVGLIATVSFHDRAKEAQTGGDLGLVIVRPTVEKDRWGWNDNAITIEQDYKRGLLCQAKVFRRTLKWGGLTRDQKKVLPERLGYFALLLYSYADPERRILQSFRWQLTENATLADVQSWLSKDNFPDCQRSEQILRSLIANRIGTDDKSIIDEVIAPESRASLEIRIHWPDGEGPPPGQIRICTQSENRVQQKVVLRH